MAPRALTRFIGCRWFGRRTIPADPPLKLPPAELITPSGSWRIPVAAPSLGVRNLVGFEPPA